MKTEGLSGDEFEIRITTKSEASQKLRDKVDQLSH